MALLHYCWKASLLGINRKGRFWRKKNELNSKELREPTVAISVLVLPNLHLSSIPEPCWLCFAAARFKTPTAAARVFLLRQGPVGEFDSVQSHRPTQACSLSSFHNCSFTSVGRVLKRSSSTTRPVFLSCRHSPSSTGRHSRRLPRSSSWVNPVSSPNREGRDCRQLFPKFKVRSFLHWNSSLGRLSIFISKRCSGRRNEKHYNL